MEHSIFSLCVGLCVLIIYPTQAFDRYTAHGGPVRGLALSPDGFTLVTASFDYSAVVWRAKGLEEQTTLLGHEAAVNTAAFSNDGNLLATAGDDGIILLWAVKLQVKELKIPYKSGKVHLNFQMIELTFLFLSENLQFLSASRAIARASSLYFLS